MDFLHDLRGRNEALFFFGAACLLASLFFLGLTRVSNIQVYHVNAWFKPFKFAVSTWLFAWAMGWYCHYLHHFPTHVFNWTVIGLLGFEIVYIAWQAGRGEQSHYNTSTPVYAALFSMMALAASVVTLFTAYAGYRFFVEPFPDLPAHYVWAIRLGILIFVVFSFEGFLMGSRLSHSVGATNDNSDLWAIGWSRTVGDLRVAHFIGMHALQVLPVVSFYVLRSTRWTWVIAVLYGALAVFTLVQALQGRPLFPQSPNPAPNQGGTIYD